MEKYTVDIDKVLDDFEETEALKIDNSHKSTHTSVLQPPMFINYNEQTQADANDVGCVYENDLQLNESDTNSNEKTTTPDKDTQSQSLGKEACPKYLDPHDGCNSKDNSFKENGVEVSDIKNTPEQICVSSKSSLSISKIQNGINTIHDSCYSSNVTSNDNNEKSNFVNEFDSVDAIKTALKTVSESHSVKEGTVLFPINSTCDNNEYFQNSYISYLDNITIPETERAGSFQELEGIKWDLPVLNLKESSADEPKISEETVTKFPNSILSLPLSDNSEQNCDSNSETAKPSSFKNLVISKIEAAASEADEHGSQNDSSNSASNSAAQDNKEHQIVDQRVPPHQGYFQQYEPISEDDDDSGVSSEEGNNSPLFFFNNEMLNGDDGAHAVANQETGLSEDSDKPCDNLEDLENRTSCITNLSVKLNEIAKSNENLSELQPVDGVPLSESTVNSLSSNKFTGARPKLDGQISQNPVPDAANEESEIQSDNKIVKNDCANNSETDIQQSKTEAISEISEAVHCDISDPPDVVPAYSSCNIESEIMNDDKSTEAELDNQVSSTKKSVSSDTNKECPLPSDLKTENFQQRLSRPTTLDLPSRHLSVSQSVGENNVNVTETNNTLTAPATDFLSSENLGEDSTSEPFPRQQPKIGLVKPFWIPDAEAPNCMHCGVKFTVIKRRHHCRACGKVLCSRCCNLKAKLAYLNKEDRICHPCFEILSSSKNVN